MVRAKLAISARHEIGAINPRIFGSFVEHLGRCVYTGIYEPGHPSADERGFRQDVLELVRELGVTAIRYPGGNFVSGYRWEDGVGPVQDRPRRLDLAWHTLETNEFGLLEFSDWAGEAGLETMLAVNLGTRGIEAALDLLEYTNADADSTLAGLRARHGQAEPLGVRMWCLGNEMDGPWQVGHKTAREYGRLAAETARAMRRFDPDLELVACGSSSSSMPTFGQWEAEVLDETYELVDAISLHAYYEEVDGDLPSFLASATDMDAFIESIIATADHIGATKHSPKKLNLSFDEWNVWYQLRTESTLPTDWPQAPRLLEDCYTAADAVVVGSLLISLLRHCNRVTSACLAQLVNVIAPIRSEPGGPAWRQTIFYPFSLTAKWMRGVVLQTTVEADTTPTKRFGAVPAVDAVAAYDDASGEVTVLCVNRHPSERATLDLDLSGFGSLQVAEHLSLGDPDPTAANRQEDPGRVVPYAVSDTRAEANHLTADLPSISWHLLRLVPSRD